MHPLLLRYSIIITINCQTLIYCQLIGLELCGQADKNKALLLVRIATSAMNKLSILKQPDL